MIQFECFLMSGKSDNSNKMTILLFYMLLSIFPDIKKHAN